MNYQQTNQIVADLIESAKMSLKAAKRIADYGGVGFDIDELVWEVVSDNESWNSSSANC